MEWDELALPEKMQTLHEAASLVSDLSMSPWGGDLAFRIEQVALGLLPEIEKEEANA